MAGAVEPTVWARALRDHGPEDSTLRLALLVLRTYMNRDGEAYPSQATIAAGAALAEFTVRRALARAEQSGWIERYERRGPASGQAWRRHGYRATVPERVDLGPYLRAGDGIEGAHAECAPTRGRRRQKDMRSPLLSEADRRLHANLDAAREFLERTEHSRENVSTEDAHVTAEVRTLSAERAHSEHGTCALSATKVRTQSALKSSSEVTYEVWREGHGEARGLRPRATGDTKSAKRGNEHRTGDEAQRAIATLLAADPSMGPDTVARVARCDRADVDRFLQRRSTGAAAP